MTTQTSSAADRCLQILWAMRGHAINGVSNGELAHALKLNPATVTRMLATLEARGFVRKLDTGRYAPSTAFLQYAMATADELDRASARIQEIRARITTGTHP